MRAIVIDAMIVCGLLIQATGLYIAFGPGWAGIVVGTEMAALGIMGAAR